MRFSCSACGQTLKTSATSAGRAYRCPACGGLVQIPAAAPVAGPAASLPPAEIQVQPSHAAFEPVAGTYSRRVPWFGLVTAGVTLVIGLVAVPGAARLAGSRDALAEVLGHRWWQATPDTANI